METDSFFANNPVFRVEHFREQCCKDVSEETVQTKLKRLKASGRIRQLVSGVYAVVPIGEDAAAFTADPLLVASRLSPDSLLAYHSAFEALGFANQVFSQVTYLTASSHRRTRHLGSNTFVALSPPKRLGKGWDKVGVETIRRQGLEVMVTSRERTFVDCLSRPQYSGGLEELFACVGALPSLDFDLVRRYLKALHSPTLYARAGFVLERFGSKLFIEEAALSKLERSLPKSPVYLLRRGPGNILARRWNLLVPPEILRKEESPLR